MWILDTQNTSHKAFAAPLPGSQKLILVYCSVYSTFLARMSSLLVVIHWGRSSQSPCPALPSLWRGTYIHNPPRCLPKKLTLQAVSCAKEALARVPLMVSTVLVHEITAKFLTCAMEAVAEFLCVAERNSNVSGKRSGWSKPTCPSSLS